MVLERYIRNVSALSEDECKLLGEKRVVIVGCGGLGGLCIEALARIGVGHLRVIDGDVFEESNLNRQLLCTEGALGREKALVAAERVKHINSIVEVDARVTMLTGKTISVTSSAARVLHHDGDTFEGCEGFEAKLEGKVKVIF